MIALFAPDPEATDAIGGALAQLLAPGDVVLMHGDLGAGKSALARAIIRARLGDPELAVPSPTFALVQPYPGIMHADLYRLSHEDELFELGLFDDDQAIKLIEWPDRAPGLADHAGISIDLDIDGEGRALVIRPIGGRTIDNWASPLALWNRTEGRQ